MQTWAPLRSLPQLFPMMFVEATDFLSHQIPSKFWVAFKSLRPSPIPDYANMWIFLGESMVSFMFWFVCFLIFLNFLLYFMFTNSNHDAILNTKYILTCSHELNFMVQSKFDYLLKWKWSFYFLIVAFAFFLVEQKWLAETLALWQSCVLLLWSCNVVPP